MTVQADGDVPWTEVPGPPVPPQAVSLMLEKLWLFSALVFSGASEYPSHMGSCSFVSAGGGAYILTAAHVWDALSGDQLFLMVEPDKPLLLVQRQFLQATVFRQAEAAAHGPDLAFLKLPDLDAREILRSKAFYNLDSRAESLQPPQYGQAFWVVLGAPAEHSRFEAPKLDLRMTILGSRIRDRHEASGFDYVDLAFDRIERPQLPSSFGGVSGSGLWHIPLMHRGEGVYWAGDAHLEGVAYYQQFDGTDPSTGFIRCHGRRSIYDQRPRTVA